MNNNTVTMKECRPFSSRAVGGMSGRKEAPFPVDPPAVPPPTPCAESIDQYELFETEKLTPDGKKSDGGEPTPPSGKEEPLIKTEPPASKENTPPPAIVTPEKQPDIFDDLVSLGLTLDELTPSEKLLTTLPVRKPRKDEWVRCHPEIQTPVSIYESTEAREIHLILSPALEALQDVARYVRMTLTVSYSGETFIWPVPIPSGRKACAAHISSHAAAVAAVGSWVRIAWKVNDYEVTRRKNNAKTPEWPAEIPDASEMLRFACKAGGVEVIGSPDHPVVQALLGLS